VKPIPIFGTGMKSLSASVTAQRRVNCFFDQRKDNDKTSLIVRGTPGSFGAFTLTDAPIRGWRQIGSFLYVMAGSTLFQVTSGGGVTNLGTVFNSGQYVSFTDNSLQLMFVDGFQGYYLTLPSGAITQITDANFPNGATTCDTLSSSGIVEKPDTREFYVSDILDYAVWTSALSLPIFGTKEDSSDKLVRVAVLNGGLLLLGSQNIEFWQDVGTSPLPFARINGASQTWGLAAKFSYAALNNTAIFLGQNPQGGVQVLMLNGYTPQRVSDSDLENIITGFSIYSDAVSLTYMTDGHPMYQLTFPNANRSFLFDALTHIWYEVQSGLVDYVRHFANLGVTFNARNYVSDTTTGVIYQLSSAIYADSGAPIKRVITSKHLRLDGNEFGISELTLEMATGVGIAVGQGANPQVMLRVSKDNGNTFGPERWRSFGRMGEYGRRVIFDTLGSSRDFVMQFTVTDPVKFVVNLAEAVISPGTEVGT
jgi:hypothetical protein